jgi:hypothetical protein
MALNSVATLPNHSATQNGHGRGRGRGRGRGGRGRGGRGGRVKENTAASRRRITAVNKRMYPPDGAPVAPLGASHSANLDGMYPCVTSQAPTPAAAPKKRTWDVVSEGDIILGKRARRERVRQN